MIDPAAGSRFSGQSAQIQLTSKTTLNSLPSGSAVSVFVEDVGAGGSVVLRLFGKRVLATSRFPLRKGEWYSVRATRNAGGISLRLESQVPRALVAAEVAKSAGLADNAIAHAVVRAFLRSGLPIDPGRLQRVYKRVLSHSSKSEKSAREIARLEALAERKGLSLDDDAWAMIDSLHGGFGSQSGSQHQSQENPREPGSGGKPPVAADPESVRAAFSLSAEADHPLHLFNHMVGEGDHWVMIPISAPGRDLEATLRIRVPRGYALGGNTGMPSVREATLLITRGATRWLFGLRPKPAGLSVVLLSHQGEGELPPDLATLATRLEESGIDFRSDQIAEEWDDGYSQSDGADIMTSVDSSA